MIMVDARQISCNTSPALPVLGLHLPSRLSVIAVFCFAL